MTYLEVDVVVIGAGVAGLMLTKKLADLGISLALIERNEKSAMGPSTKNEGWLHRGTYHANSIKDRQMAIQVSRRCIYGYEQVVRYAPEAVEDINIPSFAVLKNEELYDDVISRWKEADVSFVEMNKNSVEHILPEINAENVSSIFRVKDLGINTRILYSKLLTHSEKLGVHTFNNAFVDFTNFPRHQIAFSNNDTKIEIAPKLYIHTTGYGIKDLFQSQFQMDLPLRFWKSHLIVTPKLSKQSVFFLDAREAAMMNHGRVSIVGLNEDAFMCESPDFDAIEEKIQNILQAVSRLFKITRPFDFLPVACIKADLASDSRFARSLNINIFEPIDGHICALPGKMTETPYLTDILTKLVYEKLSDQRIAQRPMDDWDYVRF